MLGRGNPTFHVLYIDRSYQPVNWSLIALSLKPMWIKSGVTYLFFITTELKDSEIPEMCMVPTASSPIGSLILRMSWKYEDRFSVCTHLIAVLFLTRSLYLGAIFQLKMGVPSGKSWEFTTFNADIKCGQ